MGTPALTFFATRGRFKGHRAAVMGLLAGVVVFAAGEPAHARLVRLKADAPVVIDLQAFGATGRYLKISGTFDGELDPSDAHNAGITDIALAPRENGKVRYTSTFMILRPADLERGNRKLFYDFGNRGNKRILQWLNDGQESDDPASAEDFGHGFLMRSGYTVAWSGWAGDVAARPNMMSITLPIAKNPDGSPITGQVIAELIPNAATDTKVRLPYPASSISPTNGTLTMRQRESDTRIRIADWTWTNEREISFAGAARVQWIYEFVYEAKDTKVMGIGHAATRDFLSFLKYADKDDAGTPNPLAVGATLRARFGDDRASHVAVIYSWGRSQGGRVQRDFLRYGFNQDEGGRVVFDGMMPYATGSGGNMWMNFRFSQPTVSAQQHSRRLSHEPELPHTFAALKDPMTGETSGVLQSCLASNSCPKVFNVESANEYWNKSSSLNHTDAGGKDLPIDDLEPGVRHYFIASIQHNTVFDAKAARARSCQQLVNPLYNGPVFRALAVALDQWVMSGMTPPASVVPHSGSGTLVPPQTVAFPAIPATAYGGWPALPAVQFNPQAMNVNVAMDFTKVPPQPKGEPYTTLVPQVDRDGNDLGGIRLPYLQAPLATFNGWGLLKQEFGGAAPDICQQLGQFIPFANTKAERMAAGDPRLSIEERYPDQAGYVRAVKEGAETLVRDRFLLVEDQDRMVETAMQKGTDLWKAPR
jgi:Alpha/beta hydrolase domain